MSSFVGKQSKGKRREGEMKGRKGKG